MHPYIDRKSFFSTIDLTYLKTGESDKHILKAYETYNNLMESGDKAAAFCTHKQGIETLISSCCSPLVNLCMVINYPLADQSFSTIEREFKLAAQVNAEVDLVFPSQLWISACDDPTSKKHTAVIELMKFYQSMCQKYAINTVKMILETSAFYEVQAVDALVRACELTYIHLYDGERLLFLKTSTGKIYTNENHYAASRVLFAFVHHKGKDMNNKLGIKLSGGFDSLNKISNCVGNIDNFRTLVKSGRFRVGSSSLTQHF
jgi:deoxyribose-phosphate aldolase